MGNIVHREPTIEDLLSDPLMHTVLQHARKTPADMRTMLRDAAAHRLARAAAQWKTERRSSAELRALVSDLLDLSKASGDPQTRMRFAELALALALRAERIEREQEAAKG